MNRQDLVSRPTTHQNVIEQSWYSSEVCFSHQQLERGPGSVLEAMLLANYLPHASAPAVLYEGHVPTRIQFQQNSFPLTVYEVTNRQVQVAYGETVVARPWGFMYLLHLGNNPFRKIPGASQTPLIISCILFMVESGSQKARPPAKACSHHAAAYNACHSTANSLAQNICSDVLCAVVMEAW